MAMFLLSDAASWITGQVHQRRRRPDAAPRPGLHRDAGAGVRRRGPARSRLEAESSVTAHGPLTEMVILRSPNVRKASVRTQQRRRTRWLPGTRSTDTSSSRRTHTPAPISTTTGRICRRDFHDEFDAWAKTYISPFDDLIIATAKRNWDSELRMAEMDADGVAARGAVPQHRSAVLSDHPQHHHQPAPHPRRVREALGRRAGPQPLAGRLLLAGPDPPPRPDPDLPQRHRAGHAGDPLGGRAGLLRRRAGPAGLAGRPKSSPRCSTPATSRSGRCARSSTSPWCSTRAPAAPRCRWTSRRPTRC